MKYWPSSIAIAAAAMALLCHGANASSLRQYRTDPRLQATSIGVGAATTVGFFALRDWKLHGNHRVNGLTSVGAAVVTTAGCLALSPIVGTLLVGRELTFREAYGLTADCLIPFIGAWLVNKAFDAHPEWEGKKASIRSERSGRRRPSRNRQ
jgi:hypothetical protein